MDTVSNKVLEKFAQLRAGTPIKLEGILDILVGQARLFGSPFGRYEKARAFVCTRIFLLP
jgi:hypothetical protein